MIIALLGPDGFSKKSYISSLAAKERAGIQYFDADSAPAKLADFLEQDLFAKKKLFVLESVPAGFEFDDAILDKLSASPNILVFSLEKIDKRLNNNKKLLAHKKVKITEFPLPHGKELDEWIINKVGELGGKISKPAASVLAQRLGRDDAEETRFGGKVVDLKEIFTLWHAESEIQKLLAYAGGREIAEDEVAALVSENGEADALQIVNAIADKQKQAAFAAIGKFLGDGDDKGQIIQLNALLSEQFRNILALQDLLERRVPEAGILETTGWKSGRLFVLKKIAGRFQQVKVRDTLNKLAALDQELKSTSTPPRVLLDLIVTQLFV